MRKNLRGIGIKINLRLAIVLIAAIASPALFANAHSALAQTLGDVSQAQGASSGATSGCGAGQGGPGLNGSYPTSSIKTLADAQAAAGRSYGDGQCVALTKAMSPGTPSAATWTRGALVQGNGDIPVGTPIATFNYSSGEGSTGYGPPDHPGGWYGVSHTGIYLGQDSKGIWILDQFKGSASRVHQITWDQGSGCNMNSAKECAGRYYVVSNAGGASGGGSSSNGAEDGKNDPLASVDGNDALDGSTNASSTAGGATCQVPSATEQGRTVNLATGSTGGPSAPGGLGSLGGSGGSGTSGSTSGSSSGSPWNPSYTPGQSFEMPRLEGRNF